MKESGGERGLGRLVTARRLRFLLDVSLLKAGTTVSGLLAPILILRELGPDYSGRLQYLTALCAIPTIFYSYFPNGITRFASLSGTRERAEVFVVNSLYALGILAVALSLGGAFLFWDPRGFTKNLLAGMPASGIDIALALLAAGLVLGLVSDLFSALLSTVGGIKLNQLIFTLRSLAALGGIAPIVYMDLPPQRSLLAILAVRAGSQALGAAALAWALLREKELFRSIVSVRGADLRRLSEEFRRGRLREYTLPLQVSAVGSFVKENLVVLVLGRIGMMPEAAYFDVLKRIFDVPRKLIPNFLNMLLPKLLLHLKSGREQFKEDFDKISWLQFAGTVAFGTAMVAGHRQIAHWLHVKESWNFDMMLFIFAMNLVINSQAQSNSFLIRMGEDTRIFMIFSLVRITVITLMTSVLVPRMGGVGGALAVAISTVVVVAITVYESGRLGLLDLGSVVRQMGLACVVCCVWSVCLRFVFR